MSITGLRNKAKWFVPVLGIAFFSIDFFGSQAYRMWKGMHFPSWLNVLFLLTGLLTLILALVCTPKWQSFVGWAAVLLVAWHAISI